LDSSKGNGFLLARATRKGGVCFSTETAFFLAWDLRDKSEAKRQETMPIGVRVATGRVHIPGGRRGETRGGGPTSLPWTKTQKKVCCAKREAHGRRRHLLKGGSKEAVSFRWEGRGRVGFPEGGTGRNET